MSREQEIDAYRMGYEDARRERDYDPGRIEHRPPRIIRTVAELEAFDPDTAILANGQDLCDVRIVLEERRHFGWEPDLPAVVVATGEQVRAARKALEEA